MRKAYPVLPYLIGLFVTVIALVLLSYLVQLRNRQELMQVDESQEVKALRQELHICYRTGESEHPVMRAFAPVVQLYRIPIEYPLDLLQK